MPKDADAVLAIGTAFEALLAFCKENAAAGKDWLESKVREILSSKGVTVFGYKKALQCLVDNFAQYCGIMLIDPDNETDTDPEGDDDEMKTRRNVTEKWRKKYYKQVRVHSCILVLHSSAALCKFFQLHHARVV